MYRISYVGASDQEKAEAQATLKVLLSSYLNALSLQQTMNGQMRSLTVSAIAAGTTGSRGYLDAIASLKLTAQDAGSIAANSLERIKDISKKDPGIWQSLEMIRAEMSSSGTITTKTVKTQSGTQFSVSTGTSIQQQVGVVPVLVIVVVAIAVTAIASAVVAAVLTSSNRKYAATVQSTQRLLLKSAQDKLAVAAKIQQAADDLAAGRITRVQYDSMIDGYKASLEVIKDTEENVVKPSELPKPPSLGFGSALKVLVPVAIFGGIGYVAWKLGLFNVAKREISKRYG